MGSIHLGNWVAFVGGGERLELPSPPPPPAPGGVVSENVFLSGPGCLYFSFSHPLDHFSRYAFSLSLPRRNSHNGSLRRLFSSLPATAWVGPAVSHI